MGIQYRVNGFWMFIVWHESRIKKIDRVFNLLTSYWRLFFTSNCNTSHSITVTQSVNTRRTFVNSLKASTGSTCIFQSGNVPHNCPTSLFKNAMFVKAEIKEFHACIINTRLSGKWRESHFVENKRNQSPCSPVGKLTNVINYAN